MVGRVARGDGDSAVCGGSGDGEHLYVGGGIGSIACTEFGYGRRPAVEHITRFGGCLAVIDRLLPLAVIVLPENGRAVLVIERDMMFHQRAGLEDGCQFHIVVHGQGQGVVLRIEIALAVSPVVKDIAVILYRRDGNALVQVRLKEVVVVKWLLVIIEIKGVNSQHALVDIEDGADSDRIVVIACS